METRIASRLVLAAIGAAVAVGPSAPAADTIRLQGGEPISGVFAGYRGGAFTFQTPQGERREPSIKVASLVVDPPVRCAVHWKTRSKPESMVLKGYAESRFTFVPASGGEQQAPGMQIASIEPELDFDRTIPSPPAAPAAEPDAAGTNAVKLARPGVITVVHFNMTTIMSSVRQGSYVQTLARDSKGKVEVVVIDVPDWGAPAIKTYGLVSLPQFWFYDRRGQLVTRLTERFTETDIDNALKQAKR